MTAIPPAELIQPVGPQKVEKSEIRDFEKDFLPTLTTSNGVVDQFKKIQEEKRIKDLNAKKTADTAIFDYWTNALPYYRQTILSLRDILRAEGAKNDDEVETHPAPLQFLQCLPESISSEDIGKNFGEIKLSKKTNMDFIISVQGNSDDQRPLKISCNSGYLIVHPYAGNFYCRIKTVGIEDYEFPCSFEESKQKAYDALMALIDGQTAYLSQTNK
jgi:hypothetical protein